MEAIHKQYETLRKQQWVISDRVAHNKFLLSQISDMVLLFDSSAFMHDGTRCEKYNTVLQRLNTAAQNNISNKEILSDMLDHVAKIIP